MERLRQRADFLAAASGIKVSASAFMLQARRRADDGPVRFGLTVSKKVGNAVERKVAFVPGTPFYPNKGGENTMRLNFSNATHENIVEGITRLGRLFKENM